jgi:hypothetical protein
VVTALTGSRRLARIISLILLKVPALHLPMGLLKVSFKAAGDGTAGLSSRETFQLAFLARVSRFAILQSVICNLISEIAFPRLLFYICPGLGMVERERDARVVRPVASDAQQACAGAEGECFTA